MQEHFSSFILTKQQPLVLKNVANAEVLEAHFGLTDRRAHYSSLPGGERFHLAGSSRHYPTMTEVTEAASLFYLGYALDIKRS